MYRNKRYEYPAAQHKMFGYPYRVWIFSILITSLLEIALISILSDNSHAKFSMFNDLLISSSGFLIMGFFLTALSIPAMMIYILLFWQLIRSKLPGFYIKLILPIVTLVCIGLTNYFFTGNFLFDFFESSGLENLPALFSIVFLILSIAFSLKEK